MNVEIIILIGVLYLLLLLVAVLNERKLLKKFGMFLLWLCLWLCMILGVLGGGYYMIHHIRSRIVPISKAKTGNTVLFGSYEQDGDEGNGAETIEWIVLDKEDGKLLLLSKYVLDARAYAGVYYGDVTWAESSMRSWLNGTFYQYAFSEKEQGQIQQTRILNEDNPSYGTEGGNATSDTVFLLSIEEAERYFFIDQKRRAKATAYAMDNEVWTDRENYAYWWLRSPGYYSGNAAHVHDTGAVHENGSSVNCTALGVRPALWVSVEE